MSIWVRVEGSRGRYFFGSWFVFWVVFGVLFVKGRVLG